MLINVCTIVVIVVVNQCGSCCCCCYRCSVMIIAQFYTWTWLLAYSLTAAGWRLNAVACGRLFWRLLLLLLLLLFIAIAAVCWFHFEFGFCICALARLPLQFVHCCCCCCGCFVQFAICWKLQLAALFSPIFCSLLFLTIFRDFIFLFLHCGNLLRHFFSPKRPTLLVVVVVGNFSLFAASAACCCSTVVHQQLVFVPDFSRVYILSISLDPNNEREDVYHWISG